MTGEHAFARHWRRRGSLWLALAAFLIIVLTLFAGGEIGLSDNGDFYRVMTASSLEAWEGNRAFTYIDTCRIVLTENSAAGNAVKILFGAEGLAEYPSIQILLVRISVVLSLLVNKVLGREIEVYHLGLLGLLYAALYAWAIGYFFSRFSLGSWRRDLPGKALMLLVLCDVGYTAYFNSLYGEGLQHIALIFFAGSLVQILLHPPRLRDGVCGALSALVYGWAKFFNIPAACFMLLLFAALAILRGGRRWAAAFCGGAMAVLLAVFLVVPSWMNETNTYNTVFFGVVRDVEEEQAGDYVEDLGLPREMAVLRDTNYFTNGVWAALEQGGWRDVVNSVSKVDLVLFYLTHPGRTWEQAEITVQNCGMIRPYYLSNYGPDNPMMVLSHRMGLWSALRERLPFNTMWGNLLVLAAAGVVCGFFLRKRREKRGVWIALGLLTAGLLGYTFLIPIVSNGEADLAKHMFAFIELMDLLVLLVLAGLFSLRRGCRLPAVAAGVLVILLLLPAAADGIRSLAGNTRTYDEPEVGAWISLGQWEGEDLLWQVVAEENGVLTLMSASSVASLPFDEGGDGTWTDSSLRAWLNGPFLEAFSQEERNALTTQETMVVCSASCRQEAEAGDRELYCSHIPSLASRDLDRAYRIRCTDLVTLPDVGQITALDAEGRDWTLTESHWLTTPYYSNSALVRCAGSNGTVPFADASSPLLVRPCLQISCEDGWEGSGSKGDPFTLPLQK